MILEHATYGMINIDYAKNHNLEGVIGALKKIKSIDEDNVVFAMGNLTVPKEFVFVNNNNLPTHSYYVPKNIRVLTRGDFTLSVKTLDWLHKNRGKQIEIPAEQWVLGGKEFLVDNNFAVPTRYVVPWNTFYCPTDPVQDDVEAKVQQVKPIENMTCEQFEEAFLSNSKVWINLKNAFNTKIISCDAKDKTFVTKDTAFGNVYTTKRSVGNNGDIENVTLFGGY